MSSKPLVSLVAVLCLVSIAGAQDSHYWTYQYGTRSTLLGGAVVGSVLDLSGTFYNPGGLALVENPEVLMAAEAFHYTNYVLDDINGRSDVSLTSPSLSSAPSLLAGSLNFGRKEAKNLFYYSFLTRHYADIAIAGTHTQSDEISAFAAGETHLYGRLNLVGSLSETWIGFTWARKLSPRVGVGISQYITLRGQSGGAQLIAQVLEPSGDMAATLVDNQYAYSTVGLLWKGGIIFDYRKWTLGLTVTTPNIHLYGTGEAGINNSANGQDLDGDGATDTIMIADFQSDVAARYQHPFSLGLGVTYKLAAARLYFSLEWFASLDHFTVLDLDNFTGQSSGEEVEFALEHELSSVINYALGIEYRWRDNLVTYLSVTKDHSAKKEGSESNLTITQSDIWHTMVGAIFSVKRFNFTVGLGYSWSRDTFIWDYDDRAGSSDFEEAIGVVHSFDYSYSSIRLLFGISF